MPHSVNLELRILGETIYRKRSEYNSVSLSLQAGGNQRMVLNDYYVYVYIDPRDFKPFYYGKGKGSRKQAHLLDTGESEKSQRIADIKKEGLEPLIRVLARDLSEVCQLFCVNGQVFFWGWVREGRGQFPLPSLSDCRKGLRFMTPPAPGPASVPARES